MKKFLKVVVWILVLAAVCVGVYFVLPEYPQDYVKSIVQPMVDAEAKARVDQVKSLLNKDLGNVSYQTILEAKTKNSCWAYEIDENTGVETVTFHGRGLTMNLTDWTEYNGKLSTSAIIKMEFVITGGKQVSIHPYVDGELMEINDNKHEDANEDIRLEILKQAYNGGKLED